MKIVIPLCFLLGLAVGLEPAVLGGRGAPSPKAAPDTGHVHVSRMEARAERPGGYETSTVVPSHQRSKAALQKLPAELGRQSLQRRRGSSEVPRKLQRQTKAAEFFECTNSNPRPSTADCDVIASQLLSSSDAFIITANSCLVFSYRTCQGFFCSLCQTMTTTTDFIGRQLDTVDALCVENGQSGTIVAEEPPQWDAGFTYSGRGLPTFDVC